MTDSERDALFRASGWRVVAFLWGVLKGAYGVTTADMILTSAVKAADRREVPSEPQE